MLLDHLPGTVWLYCHGTPAKIKTENKKLLKYKTNITFVP